MKTRDIKELLILLSDNAKGRIGRRFYQIWGLCSLTLALYEEGIITQSEEDIVNTYLHDNRPDGKSGMDYWFPRGEKQPRLDWLNEQIAKL
jgi:hypothetical protein